MFERTLFQLAAASMHALATGLDDGIRACKHERYIQAGMKDAHTLITRELDRLVMAYTRTGVYEAIPLMIRVHACLQTASNAMNLLHERDIVDPRYAYGYLAAILAFTSALEDAIREISQEQEPCECGTKHGVEHIDCLCEQCTPDIADVHKAFGEDEK